MSTIKNNDLLETFVHMYETKVEQNKTVLLSSVEKISFIDPLTFYHNGYSLYSGERFFWKHPQNEVIIVGLGNIYTIRSEHKDHRRYKEVDDKWKKLLDQAAIHNLYSVPSIGPLLFGGFSFDPEQETQVEWGNFSPSFFYLPEYMLTIRGKDTFLTMNIAMTNEDEEKLDVIRNVMNRRETFLQPSLPVNTTNPVITGIKEEKTDQWKQAVNEVVERIHSNPKLEKVVLARKISAEIEEAILPENVLQKLLDQQQDSFIFSFEAMDDCFVGASPERLVRKWGNEILSTCLAGSIARGKDAEEDEKLGQALLQDQKNRREHQLVVQMISEVLHDLCEKVYLPSSPTLMKIRDIQHLYTPVIGKTNQDLSILRFVEKLHPTPALGGLPTKDALEEIRHFEMMDRGFYAGPIGWIDYKGNGEFAVAIRSGLIRKKSVELYAGCGIVADSDAESEFNETGIKFRPMLRAIGGTLHE
ncbi:menaquinone-specific isochorismate synthase [Oikeobacillus pervagus]|uniref:isochorismate synthase n=1 Tax=Oikeobacillus pervagus TaxID=1325931 RepID=A0AAJ1T4P3_9BACI|nr:isochorismate synthase [Oikeobacillus pervagus]MDQ0216566.1 menaquinone-specific isochorismate synthase [Oikeobacillus pervagus]